MDVLECFKIMDLKALLEKVQLVCEWRLLTKWKSIYLLLCDQRDSCFMSRFIMNCALFSYEPSPYEPSSMTPLSKCNTELYSDLELLIFIHYWFTAPPCILTSECNFFFIVHLIWITLNINIILTIKIIQDRSWLYLLITALFSDNKYAYLYLLRWNL